MWKKGDIVLHGSDGVCRITDIRRMDLIGEGMTNYYILESVYKKGLTIYVEVGEGDDDLRLPMERDEIDALIRTIPDIKKAQWISNDKLRQTELSRQIRDSSLHELFSITNMLYERKQELTNAGKKFRASDEQLLSRAENIINRELAYGIGHKPEEVPVYIRKILAG